MTTIESGLGDDRSPRRRRVGQAPPVWMEKPNPVIQVVKAIALGISVTAGDHSVLVGGRDVVADQKTINDPAAAWCCGRAGVSLGAYQAILSGGL